MATPDKTEATPADVESQIQEIRTDIAKLVDLLGDLAGTQFETAKTATKGEAEDLLKRTRDMADQAHSKARETTESVETYIKEKPIQSALIALTVGLVLGALTRR